MSDWRRTLRACGLLTGSTLARMAREGMVVRSLAYPPVIVIGTLVAVATVFAWLNYSDPVLLTADLSETTVPERLVEYGFEVEYHPDPGAAVMEGEAWVGTDGETIYLQGLGRRVTQFEGIIRDELGARWTVDVDLPLPGADQVRGTGTLLVAVTCLLYALYGVVFGAGMVARDIDQGTLDVEVALPVPRWVHGVARLTAASGLLGAFILLTILGVDAVMGVRDTAALARHGLANAVGSTSLGMLVIGRGGMKRGFSGALGIGLSAAVAVFAIGLVLRPVAPWIPVASMTTDASGWEALVGAAVAAWLAMLSFRYRTVSQ